MCHRCYSEADRQKTYEAARALGRRGEYAQPFPVGSCFRNDWEAGLEKGMSEIPMEERKPLAAKGKPQRKR